MHNELTKKDIELMRRELDYRRTVLRPQLIEDVQTSAKILSTRRRRRRKTATTAGAAIWKI